MKNKIFKYFSYIFIIVLFLFTFACKKKEYVKVSSYPVDAVKYIKENIDYKNVRIFNQYDYGSYLLFEEIPVFIDSRADLYLEEFNKDCTVFKDYFDAKLNYKYQFNIYDIDYVLLRNDTPLYTTIVNYENYNKVYKDDYFTLYKLGD